VLASISKSLLGVAAVRRVTTTLALALCLLGCSSAASAGGSAAPTVESAAPAGEPVALRTGKNSCYLTLFPIVGRLLPDPVYGVTLDGVPIIWPTGSTAARLAGGQVEVRVTTLNGGAAIVATTGKDYWLANGMTSGDGNDQFMVHNAAFAACLVLDAEDTEAIKVVANANGAQRASDWFQGQKEALVITNIRTVWCGTAPRPDWCEWVRRFPDGPVVSKIEDANLTVGVRKGTPVGLAEELCRDVAADDNVLPDGWAGDSIRNRTWGVYSHVDVEAGPAPSYGPTGIDWFAEGVRLADCSVPLGASPSP
jgi:hypothetical protein